VVKENSLFIGNPIKLVIEKKREEEVDNDWDKKKKKLFKEKQSVDE